MGLINATVESAKSVLHDQWLEYYYCDSLSENELVKKASKKVNQGSNTKSNPDIITNGSYIAVNEGQAMLVVEDGKIIDFTVVPGEFIWNTSSEPSLFDNGWKGLKESFKIFGRRFTTGGTEARVQRIYYVNIKEILNNKFGSATPMSYNDPTYRSIYIRYFGTYSFKISDPLAFYANISGNVTNVYTKNELMQQCDAEFVGALDEALAKCSDEGFQFNDLPKRQREIAVFMNDALDDQWRRQRGMEVVSVALVKVTPDDTSRKRIETIDDAIMLSDARVAQGHLAGAQAEALQKAAANDAGAFTGFLGMGMMQQAGGKANEMFSTMQQQEDNPLFEKRKVNAAAMWTCSCGHQNEGNFCSECGKPKPLPKEVWTCSCGHQNDGKFCSECGKPKPQQGFTCSNPECGFTSDENMKFCPQCGSPNKK